jgi:hypothetical protein
MNHGVGGWARLADDSGRSAPEHQPRKSSAHARARFG